MFRPLSGCSGEREVPPRLMCALARWRFRSLIPPATTEAGGTSNISHDASVERNLLHRVPLRDHQSSSRFRLRCIFACGKTIPLHRSRFIAPPFQPGARPPSEHPQERLSRMRRVSHAVQSPRTPQSHAGRCSASRRGVRC